MDAQTDTLTIERPVPFMSPEETVLLRTAYEAASVILEYGMGGSTVMAASMPDKIIHTVESDPEWAARVSLWLEDNPQPSDVNMHLPDIGPTRKWGFPESLEKWENFAAYPLDVWDLLGGEEPDVVLIDGRFRVGCALATAFRTKRNVQILFHDYVRRTPYHVVEKYLGPPETTIGCMVHFNVDPTAINAPDLLDIIRHMMRP